MPFSFRPRPSINNITNNNNNNSSISSVQTEEPLHVHDDIVDVVQREDWYPKPLVVLVIGASGDLAKKKTYPALLALWKAKLLPLPTVVWGFARTQKTSEGLRAHLRPHLIKSLQNTNDADGTKQATVDEFLSRCFYRAGKSYDDWPILQGILSETNDNESLHNLLVYLAIPPHVFSDTTSAVKTAIQHLPVAAVPAGFTRIVLEKPFGQDTASCQQLLASLQEQQWQEDNLYRIDHYLGKEMVQNLLSMRQHNPWLRAIWCKEVVQSVHIIAKEDFGTAGRGGYFDPVGIVRDLLQNHLLQILSLVAMDLPADSQKWTANEIRNRKVDVLKSIPPILLQECLLGQYDGYRADPTIENRNTVTPTYAAVKLHVNTPAWKDVPFVLEAGKALDERVCEIRLHFQGSTTSQPNALVLRLQSTPSIFFCTNLKTPGFSETTVSTHLGVDYAAAAPQIPDAYTRLLLDVLRGHQTSFVRDDELLAAWEIFTPVLHQTERDCVKPLPYQSGTRGPLSRDEYLEAMGVGQPWLPLQAAL